jgi:hypothetical protein
VKSKHYEWQGDEMPLAFTDLPVAPDWLVQLATEKPHGRMKKVLAGVLKSQGTIVEGERNATLASLAGTLRWRQFGESELAAALSTINKSKCVPPLDEQEVLAIAASISRYEPGPSTDRGAEPTDHLPERTRKRIHVDTDEARVNDEVEAAIAIERDLYSRGQRLVRLVRQRVGAARGSCGHRGRCAGHAPRNDYAARDLRSADGGGHQDRSPARVDRPGAPHAGDVERHP